MITVVTGTDIEKLKGEFESVINGMNMVGKISYGIYSELFDVGTDCIQKAYELGKAELEKKNNEWFDATKHIPVPKNLKTNRYSMEAISSEGDLVCYDYQNKEWNKIILEDDKVSYVPVEITEWTNKPKKETE